MRNDIGAGSAPPDHDVIVLGDGAPCRGTTTQIDLEAALAYRDFTVSYSDVGHRGGCSATTSV